MPGAGQTVRHSLISLGFDQAIEETDGRGAMSLEIRDLVFKSLCSCRIEFGVSVDKTKDECLDRMKQAAEIVLKLDLYICIPTSRPSSVVSIYLSSVVSFSATLTVHLLSRKCSARARSAMGRFIRAAYLEYGGFRLRVADRCTMCYRTSAREFATARHSICNLIWRARFSLNAD